MIFLKQLLQGPAYRNSKAVKIGGRDGMSENTFCF